jgi:hypothetical protein
MPRSTSPDPEQRSATEARHSGGSMRHGSQSTQSGSSAAGGRAALHIRRSSLSGSLGLVGAVLLSAALAVPALGTTLPAAIRAGGTGDVTGRPVVALADGSGIVAGWFVGTATFGDTALVATGFPNAFVAKFDPSGGWVWASQVSGSSIFAFGLSALPDGSAIVAGWFSGTATFGGTTLTSAGSEDVFVARIDRDGSWVWASRAGSATGDSAYSVSAAADGSAIVGGYFSGVATFGALTLTSVGNNDVFVAKIGPSGVWEWATGTGASGWESINAVSTSGDGSAIVAGGFSGTVPFGGTSLTTLPGRGAVFVAKIDGDGAWVWATKAEISSAYSVQGIDTSTDGSAVIVGQYYGTAEFGDTTLASIDDGSDVFVAKLGPSGLWEWATSAGSVGFDIAYGVALVSDGSAFVSGQFSETATFGTTELTVVGNRDLFVAMIGASGSWLWATPAGSMEEDDGLGIASSSDGSAYVTGYFKEVATFGATTLTSAGGRDVFVARVDALGAWAWTAPNLPASVPAAGLSVSCGPLPLRAGVLVTCAVSGGEAGIEILWRAAYNPAFAGEGVTLDASGSGTFRFTVPAAAMGEELTVELVAWLAPVSLGVVLNPVPTSVPSGGGPVSAWPFLLLVLVSGLALRPGRPRGAGWHR